MRAHRLAFGDSSAEAHWTAGNIGNTVVKQHGLRSVPSRPSIIAMRSMTAPQQNSISSCTRESYLPLLMPRKPTGRTLFVGAWRIVHMEEWDEAYRNMEVPAHITFGRHSEGEFHFGVNSGWMDYRVGLRDGAPTAEFSWQGQCDMDECCGRGWATLIDGELRGHLYFHGSDDSAFIAKKLTRRK